MDRELVERVTGAVLIALVPATAVAALLGGAAGALGTASGALLSLISFRWIARGARGVAALFAGGRPSFLWMLGLAFRHLTLFALISLLLVSGVVHPVGLAAGVALLPPILIALGLRAVSAAA